MRKHGVVGLRFPAVHLILFDHSEGIANLPSFIAGKPAPFKNYGRMIYNAKFRLLRESGARRNSQQG